MSKLQFMYIVVQNSVTALLVECITDFWATACINSSRDPSTFDSLRTSRSRFPHSSLLFVSHSLFVWGGDVDAFLKTR